jgi:hypothetical protein
MPVFLTVQGDGSVLREIDDRTWRHYKFDAVVRPQHWSISSVSGRSPMYWEFAFVLVVPFVVLIFGSAVAWVAKGFKP